MWGGASCGPFAACDAGEVASRLCNERVGGDSVGR